MTAPDKWQHSVKNFLQGRGRPHMMLLERLVIGRERDGILLEILLVWRARGREIRHVADCCW